MLFPHLYSGGQKIKQDLKPAGGKAQGKHVKFANIASKYICFQTYLTKYHFPK